jgi:hypothetical protein
MHGKYIIKHKPISCCFLNSWNCLLKTARVKKYKFASVALRHFAVYYGYRHWALTSDEAVTCWQHSYWLIGMTDSRRHVLIDCLMTVRTMGSEGCGLHEAIELMIPANKCCHRLMRTALTFTAAVRSVITGLALQRKNLESLKNVTFLSFAT